MLNRKCQRMIGMIMGSHWMTIDIYIKHKLRLSHLKNDTCAVCIIFTQNESGWQIRYNNLIWRNNCIDVDKQDMTWICHFFILLKLYLPTKFTPQILIIIFFNRILHRMRPISISIIHDRVCADDISHRQRLSDSTRFWNCFFVMFLSVYVR